MKVPLLDLRAHHRPLLKELLAAARRILESQSFILGPEVERLEARVARLCGVRYAFGVSSGTDALLLSLMALGIKPGDEVLTTPYSFFATAGSIVRLGAVPVFVDIDPASFNIDPAKLEQAVTPRAKAVIPVHLFGQCADMEPILEIARRRGLKVIEDAAQAIGARYPGGRLDSLDKVGCRAGGLGDLSCFSFYPTKNLGGVGDGGMVVTDDPKLAEKVRKLRVHGERTRYYHEFVGGNFRLDGLQAAALNVKFPRLQGWTRRRQENAERYRALFRDRGLAPGAIGLPAVVHKAKGAKNVHVYNQYVVRARDRDRLREHLSRRGVGTEIYYPVPLHRQECFKSLGYEAGDFPESERLAREVIALPIYPELEPRQQAYVVDCIKEFYKAWPGQESSRGRPLTRSARTGRPR